MSWEDNLGLVHQFNAGVAERFRDTDKAILLHNIAFWIRKNKDTGDKCRDGHIWTYMSAEGFSKYHPYLNPRTIRRKLSELESDGVIKSANYNKNPYNRTKWYTIVDEVLVKLYNIAGEQEEDSRPDDLSDLNGQNVKCIIGNTDSNTYSNSLSEERGHNGQGKTIEEYFDDTPKSDIEGFNSIMSQWGIRIDTDKLRKTMMTYYRDERLKDPYKAVCKFLMSMSKKQAA